MERILIIGGNGFIGKELIRRLAKEKDIEVLALVRERPQESDIRELEQSGHLQVLIGDMGDQEFLQDKLPSLGTVVHLAWNTVPTGEPNEPDQDLRSNVLPSLSLLKSCLQKGIERFIFLSSGGAVYGPPQYLPIDESHPEKPVSSYGVSKLMFEKYLHYYRRKAGIEPFIFRPSTVYGAIPKGPREQGVVGIWIDHCLRGESIEQWGDGSQIKDLLFIEDLVEGIMRGIHSRMKEGTWNLGSGNGVSLQKIKRSIEALHGKPLSVIEKPFKGSDVQKNILSIEKARKELGWKPKVTFDEGIARTWKRMKKERD